MAITIVLAVFVSMVLVFIGVIILNGKGDGLISGYNTASPEQKAKYDIIKLRRVTAIAVFVVAFLSFGLQCVVALAGDNEDLITGCAIGFTVMIIVLATISTVLMNTYCKRK